MSDIQDPISIPQLSQEQDRQSGVTTDQDTRNQINRCLIVCNQGIDAIQECLAKSPLKLEQTVRIKNGVKTLENVFVIYNSMLRGATFTTKDEMARYQETKKAAEDSIRQTWRVLHAFWIPEFMAAICEREALRKEVGALGEFGLLGWELLHKHVEEKGGKGDKKGGEGKKKRSGKKRSRKKKKDVGGKAAEGASASEKSTCS